MADLVLDSHRRRTPLDHPDQSVTADKIAPQEHITFELLTEDPPLVPGRWWIRADTKELRYTIDGVKVHVIPLPFFPWSIDKYMLIQLIPLISDSHFATTLPTTLPTITGDSHSATSLSTTLPTITVEYVLS